MATVASLRWVSLADGVTCDDLFQSSSSKAMTFFLVIFTYLVIILQTTVTIRLSAVSPPGWCHPGRPPPLVMPLHGDKTMIYIYVVDIHTCTYIHASPPLWNSLFTDIRFASLLTTFHQKLKTHLFRQSYPDIVL